MNLPPASLLLVALVSNFVVDCAKQPNIVLIVADDYGWNDIGYHGTKLLKTPTLDQLAADGIKLENYYVQPICTPTRSTLMSGKYIVHTGLQHFVIPACVPTGLPLKDATLADQLKSLGYNTHMVGKWHLGDFKKEYLPTRRGFDSFFGYLNGAEDYYNHTICQGRMCGIDLYDNEEPTSAYTGNYSAHLFTNKAKKIIENHNKNSPLFLYMAYQSVHSPLQAPQEYIDKFSYIKNKQRRTYAGMVAAMDEGVRNITDALKANDLWNDTLIIFTTDNGGMVFAGANNAPLRGDKGTYYEGGVRGIGFLSGPQASQKGKVNRQLLHVADWYPTLLNLAGGDASQIEGLDGYDQWDAIMNRSSSKRHEILFNIDPKTPRFGRSMSDVFDTGILASLRYGDWKIITGPPGFSGWVPEPTYGNLKEYLILAYDVFQQASDFAQLIADKVSQSLLGHSLPVKNVRLFNIKDDPEERQEVSSQYPEVVDMLLKRLAYHNSTAVPVNFPPADNNCNPKYHNGFWGPFED